MIRGIMLVRNEQGRYLEKVLSCMRIMCDDLVILDDSSTDRTPDICKGFGASVIEGKSMFGLPLWETDELELRKCIWKWGINGLKTGDWLVCLDADEIMWHPLEVRRIMSLPGVVNSNEFEGIGFRLFDMWDQDHYRDDRYWSAHVRDWIFAVRYQERRTYKWNEQPLHCGRFPYNAMINGYLPIGMSVLHMGWSTPEDRQIKYERYMRSDPEGRYGIMEQYQSILDKSPNLVRFEG